MIKKGNWFPYMVMWLGLSHASMASQEPGGMEDGALAGNRPRVIVSTDIGGSDPDDCQSMVHLLMYADVVDLEGLIASPPEAGRVEDIHEVLDAYSKDYAKLLMHSNTYPSPDALRHIVKQGAIKSSPQAGWSDSTDGSRWIVERARVEDMRPLWLLVWGCATDVAQAIHDEPSIKRKIRIYSIGSWNTGKDRHARDYLFREHSDLWWIENDSTFRGMYMGGEQDDPWGNRSFVEAYVKNAGALGRLFAMKKGDIKMGDTPSFLYLLQGNPEDPTGPHWGGAFVKSETGATHWKDNPDLELATQGKAGASTVNRWRRDFLDDWRQRMNRVAGP